MASVSEMYDVGWEGKTKDKIDSAQVSMRHGFIFKTALLFSRGLPFATARDKSRRCPAVKNTS